jgi:mono/diheme cytochrome c family protein
VTSLRYHRVVRWTLVALLVACSTPVVNPQVPTKQSKRAPDVPMSEPSEYEIDRISRGAGEAIFTRTGIGDPYRTGVPFPIFLALLRAFPQTFGADTSALAQKFGFVPRTADAASTDPDVRAGLPIGMHLTTDPITTVPFVMTSCSLCHTERLTWKGGEATVVGLANKRVRIHAYDSAFAEITNQPAFTVEKIARLAREAAHEHHLSWPAEYSDALVANTLQALRDRAGQRAELHALTAAGPPGRVATIESFVPVLRELSGKPVAYPREVGWAKVPDVIGFRDRVTLSWDASGQGSMDLLAVEADLAAGVRVEWLERHPFQGASIAAFLRQPAPRPAFPGRLDRELVDRGKALFEKHCADCHGTYGSDGRAIDYDEQIVGLADIGTDAKRANAATDSFERVANDPALTRGYTQFRRTYGYVPPVLTNVWMRAPYGHAGQWPSLAVLAMPADKRPDRFVVDLGAPYDLATVGVATHAPAASLAPGEYLHDATSPGFGVGGHPFLAELGRDSSAVIEYLKSL